MKNSLRWLLGIFVALCILYFMTSCTKETVKTITGPTEYDTTIVTQPADTIIIYDTVQVVSPPDTIEVAMKFAAAYVVHEWYAGEYSDDVFEFMAYASIPVAYPDLGEDVGVRVLQDNMYEVTGVVYVWSAEEYFIHCDTAEYYEGDWIVNTPSLSSSLRVATSNMVKLNNVRKEK